MTESHILCPTCRTAVPDRLYFEHQARHQQAKGVPPREPSAPSAAEKERERGR